MKIPCWHRFKWDKPFEFKMRKIDSLRGVQIGDPVDYTENRQRGTCEKCGFVKERNLSPGITRLPI